MASSFFIPKKINVGFQKRSDTYTEMLAYIIYYDEKGKLRKETSWQGWRDKKIDNQIHDNEPTSGFVLNKKAGGYDTGWNHRQTYVRVYDPRGFEFEISVQNLLYILENATSTKGKGLEGDFVYGWSGKDLVLIPTDAPDYKELVNLNNLRHSENKIGARQLKIGATYRTRDNSQLIYMGKFDEYNYDGSKKAKPQFYFYNSANTYGKFITMGAVSQKLVEVISEECISNYAELMDELESQTKFSPVDKEAYEYIDYTLEDIKEELSRRRWKYVYSDISGEMKREEIDCYEHKPRYTVKEEETYRNWGAETKTRIVNRRVYADSIEELYNIVKPKWRKVYLKNGKLNGEER